MQQILGHIIYKQYNSTTWKIIFHKPLCSVPVWCRLLRRRLLALHIQQHIQRSFLGSVQQFPSSLLLHLHAVDTCPSCVGSECAVPAATAAVIITSQHIKPAYSDNILGMVSSSLLAYQIFIIHKKGIYSAQLKILHSVLWSHCQNKKILS